MRLEEIKNRLESYGLRSEEWSIIECKGDEIKLESLNKKDRILLDFIIIPKPPKTGILGRPKK